jgi:hypothetical protein
LLTRIDQHYDWLVVIGLVLPEPVELELPEVVGADVVVVVVVPVALWANAGSWPETSWKKIAPQTSANVEAAIASARFRIKATRRRRAFRRAVTPPGMSGARSSREVDVVV